MNDPRALTLRARLLLVAIGLAVLALVATARRLTPDPRGYGTHEQLGLGVCSFTQLTGWRCLTCGMTTAWAHATRGELSAALAANGGGTVLLLLTVITAPWLLASAVMGRWIIGRPQVGVLLVIGGAWLAVTMLDWLRRLATG